MSHQKTTVTQQKEHKFDILAEIINPWGVYGPPLNDAPGDRGCR